VLASFVFCLPTSCWISNTLDPDAFAQWLAAFGATAVLKHVVGDMGFGLREFEDDRSDKLMASLRMPQLEKWSVHHIGLSEAALRAMAAHSTRMKNFSATVTGPRISNRLVEHLLGAWVRIISCPCVKEKMRRRHKCLLSDRR